MQIAPGGLELEGLDGSLAQQRQLHLRHRALHAQQQPVVDAARVIDAVFVDDDAAHQRAELQQRVPVAAVARQARGLDGDHGADLAAADRRQQPLEARASDATGGHAEVIVDHHDLGPAEHARPIGQGVLASTTLVVVAQLIGGGLPHVHVGAARKCSGLILLIVILHGR